MTQELILSWLQLEGGEIKDISRTPGALTFDLLIEHPDMPDIEESEAVPEYTPLQYQMEVGDVSKAGVIVSLRSTKRIYPKRED